MNDFPTSARTPGRPLPKSQSGIFGFDDISLGGLPTGRTTLVCGGPGSGKTLFATTFLVNGATRFGEPGVLISFEERAHEIAASVASLGFDIVALAGAGMILVDYVRVERSEIEVSGEYDLEALFIRIGHAIQAVGAKRVVLDTIEVLSTGFANTQVLRTELQRLFSWMKDQGVTAVITGERSGAALTREGLEEYVSDCVILLDNRVEEQITTRRLRIVKYRGSEHGTNEYPFLIDNHGISVLPITGADLAYTASEQPISTGLPALDDMLGAGGYFRGTSVCLSGTSGTGKSILATQFANAACNRGERCLYFAMEEAPAQILRNMRSIGIDLQTHIDAGLLRFEVARTSLYGFEMHLARMSRDVREFAPDAVVVDPISAFRGPSHEVHATLVRMIDILKSRGITVVVTSLIPEHLQGHVDQGMSSLIDTGVVLTNSLHGGEYVRGLGVMKARGMGHSNQTREFRVTSQGIRMADPFRGPHGLLAGSARRAQQVTDAAEERRARRERERLRREARHRSAMLELQIIELKGQQRFEDEELRHLGAHDTAGEAAPDRRQAGPAAEDSQ